MSAPLTSRPRLLAGAGLAAVTGIATAAVLTATLGTGVPGVVPPPAASASELLPAFGDCEELRQWYVDAALPFVGAYGFTGGHGGPVLLDGLAAEGWVARAQGEAGDSLGTGDAVTSSSTGTNVQEAGVDEPDLAKTDGRTVYRVQGRRLLVVDVSGEQPRRLAEIRLPGNRWEQRELLLLDDVVIVVSSQQGYRGGPVIMEGDIARPELSGPWGVPEAGTTRLVAVDVSDRGAPRVTSDQRVDGSLVAAREYGDGTVRVVTDSGLPPFDFVRPHRDRTDKEATRINRGIVRDSTIEDWLPGVRRSEGGRQPVLGCEDVRHPQKPSGFGTITVLTFDGTDPTDLDAVAVTAAGDLVYSSADRLYVATMESSWWEPVPLDVVPRIIRPDKAHTVVHAFALDDATTSYTASGEVRGTVRDRWSFSEHDGRLRVATALGDRWRPRENAVSVLEEDGDRLRVVGTVDGLGPDEAIQSVRWFGDLAVVVTFRQTDPLYTLDLSDPTAPEVIGELKIRGFSAYLHPVGDERLLGLGRNATLRGEDLGAQAALFDLSDLGDVVRTDTLGLGRSDWFTAASDPRTFTYLPEQRVALTGVTSWRGDSRLLALEVGTDGTLREGRSWRAGRWSAEAVRALPLGDGRVALVDRGVRIIDVG